jgi:hypothetical protein
MELTPGFGPGTPSLPWKCSTTELCQRRHIAPPWEPTVLNKELLVTILLEVNGAG